MLVVRVLVDLAGGGEFGQNRVERGTGLYLAQSLGQPTHNHLELHCIHGGTALQSLKQRSQYPGAGQVGR